MNTDANFKKPLPKTSSCDSGSAAVLCSSSGSGNDSFDRNTKKRRQEEVRECVTVATGQKGPQRQKDGTFTKAF